MKLLDRYIIQKFLGTFVFAIMLFAAVAVVIDLTEKIDDLIEHKVSVYNVIFGYYVNFVPYIVALLSPLFIFISVIFFTSKLASNSEIVAMLSGGVSFYRLLVPYFISCFILAGVMLWANHFIVPNANQSRNEFEDAFIRRPWRFTQRNIHLRLSDTTYAYMESYNNRDSVGYKFTLEKIKENQMLEKLRADRIVWNSEKGSWTLKNYMVRTITSDGELLSNGTALDTIMVMKPSDFGRKYSLLEEMTTPELIAHIELEKSKGSDQVAFFEVEKHRRTSDAFMAFVLTIIGVSLASRKVRGGLGLHIVFGFGLSAAYIVMSRFSTTMATNAAFPPLLAVGIPNLVFIILALWLLKKAPK